MKKKSGSKVGAILKAAVNLRLWFDWDRMKAFSLYIGKGIAAYVVPQKQTAKESFQAAQMRLGLSEADLQVREKGLLRLTRMMLLLALLVFGLSCYYFYHFQWRGGVVGLVITCVVLTFAFRYHFWYFQIKTRTLGCSIETWYKQGLLRGKR